MNKFLATLAIVAAGVIGAANAQERSAPASLDALLEQIRQGGARDKAEFQAREREFLAARNNQAKLVQDADARQRSEEARSDRLENTFEQNEIKLAEYEDLLQKRLGSLGELFGVVRQVAGDTKGVVDSSLVSTQYPGRGEPLGVLGQSKKLPSIEQIRGLWSALMQEMVESGKVAKYGATVVTADGQQTERDVVRVGSFTAVSDGKYLKFLPESQRLAELERQPQGRFLGDIPDLEEATSGFVRFGVDPSRGSILQALVAAATPMERIEQGGPIGHTILVIGGIALLLVLERLFTLSGISRKVKAQMKSDVPDQGNPLGRVMAVYQANKHADVETLELKLDEAILKQIPPLERFLTTLKVAAAVAPLLGLLGTVTGMIATFQAITLFGTGDPKMMASGISTALVTTMEGLFVAIPIILLHSLVAGRSRSVLHVLEEQAAGIIAVHAEKEGRKAGA